MNKKFQKKPLKIENKKRKRNKSKKKATKKSELKNKPVSLVTPTKKIVKKKSIIAQLRDGDIPNPYANNRTQVKNRKIILESKKGTKQEVPAKCVECKMLATVWSYSKSNYGRVNICRSCKAIVFDRSFGKIDALDLANTGGRFEGNRHKH